MPRPALDHLGFACRELASLTAIFTRLGFLVTRPAPLRDGNDHAGAGAPVQRSAHVVMGSTYLELTAIDGTGGHHLAPYLRRGDGLHVVALRAPDLASRRESARRAGFHPGAIRRAVRRVDYGERPGEARFDWWLLPPEEAAAALVCFVHNRDPHRVYQPAAQAHPNGALDLCGLSIASPDPAAERAWWHAVLGDAGYGGDTAGDLALPNGMLSLVPAAAMPAAGAGHPEPRPAGLAVRVRNLDVASAWARRSGWPVSSLAEHGVRVALPPPAGAWLSFTA